jgi:hypothetical protein
VSVSFKELENKADIALPVCIVIYDVMFLAHSCHIYVAKMSYLRLKIYDIIILVKEHPGIWVLLVLRF